MRKCAWTILAVVVVPLLMLHPAAWADDTDEDGLPDDVEVQLGTDPAVAEEFELVAEDNVTDVEEGTEGRHEPTRTRSPAGPPWAARWRTSTRAARDSG
jgi:hypothetical protein